MSGKRRQRRYRRLDRAERAAIERGLDKNRSAREMARDLGRSQSSVADEVRRNRTVSRGPAKGERVESVPEGACARLKGWPHVCNGCNKRRYHCGRPFRCEYSAARAQGLADGTLSDSRRGVDRSEGEFERIAAAIRADLARGLSPAQISAGRSREFRAAPSTIYRWIDRGYAGMSNMELRRKVGYKERRKGAPRPTSHGPERSFAAFSALPEAAREAACEMDTVIGSSSDRQCVLTLYLRCCRAQVLLLLPERSSSAVAAALDMLETAVGGAAFQRMLGLAHHRQRGGVLRLGVAGEVVPAGCGRPLQSVLLRREAVPAEGRLRAQPRGAQEAPAQGPRHIVRRPGAGRHGGGDVAAQLRAQALDGVHGTGAGAAGGLRRRRRRAHGRARHGGGSLRGAADGRRGDRPRQAREGV